MQRKTLPIQRMIHRENSLISTTPTGASTPCTSERPKLSEQATDDAILKWLQHQVVQLPVSAIAVYEALDLLNSKPVDLDHLVAVVGSEPALAAQVVRLASADTTEGWNSLKEAVVLAGIADMQRLLLAVPLVTSFDPAYGRLTMFRRHAQITALLSRRIALQCLYPHPEEAQLAGLLHQLGTLPGLTRTDEPQADYGRIGGVLATWWRFPENLWHVIRHDDRPAQNENFLLQTVRLAADFCAQMGVLPIRDSRFPRHGVESVDDDVVSRHLPLLPPKRHAALAEAMEFEFRRWAAQFLSGAATTERLRQTGACL
jgi:HD-like signal output (HDOD) protein